MKTILRALLEILDRKAQWRTTELKALIINLLADCEKDTLDIVKVPFLETSWEERQNGN